MKKQEPRYNFVLLTPTHRGEYAVVDLSSGEIVERGMYRSEAVARASELNGYETTETDA